MFCPSPRLSQKNLLNNPALRIQGLYRGFTNRLQLPEVKKGLQNKEVSEVAKLHFLILVAKQSHNYTSAIKCIIDSYDVVCK